jgi:hypothetical protein
MIRSFGTRKIILASPREPSGVTWLVNCFLELGICCYRYHRRHLYMRRGNREYQHPREDILNRWLPALHRHRDNGFRFREGIEVEWTHDWPRRRYRNNDALFFVRDPRDALYSRYKRDDSDLGFRDYASILDPGSLLDRVDNWCLHARSWLSRNATVTRFEDYKADAERTLRGVLDHLGIAAYDEVIARAVFESDYEKARAAEERFIGEHPEFQAQRINRSGTVGAWRGLPPTDMTVIVDLMTRGADLLAKLGYCETASGEVPDLRQYLDTMPFFADMDVRAAPPVGAPDATAEARQKLADFARRLDVDLLRRARLDASEGTMLCCNLRDRLAETGDAGLADFGSIIEALGVPESVWYLSLFRRTRRLQDLRRITPAYVFQRVIGYIRQRGAGQGARR